jgi:hypothetical protein
MRNKIVMQIIFSNEKICSVNGDTAQSRQFEEYYNYLLRNDAK